MRKETAVSILSSVPLAPRDPILGLTEQFAADTRPGKVNLGVGVYLDSTGKVPLLDCVREAEQRLAAAPAPRGYLPIDGLPAYNRAVRELVFGADSAAVADGRVVTVQGLGGTGALKIGAEFLKLTGAGRQLLISDPSWENHQALFSRAGYEVGTYRYYAPALGGVDVEGMLADLRAAAPGTVVVLHACCHNPTGYDLVAAAWQQVADTVAEAGLVPFLDLAYQGFASGIEADAAVPRAFAELGVPVLVASSFSKSFSLYGERVGGPSPSSRSPSGRPTPTRPPTARRSSAACSRTPGCGPAGRPSWSRCGSGSGRCGSRSSGSWSGPGSRTWGSSPSRSGCSATAAWLPSRCSG
jgi:aromatic-amino-acid transaminase